MGEVKHTPAERAEFALTNSSAFCQLLSQARTCRAPGWWDGSAFQHHPCGLVAGVIKFTNYWTTSDLCDIVITDGAGWDTKSICRGPFAMGNPHPRPIDGGVVQVWRCGEWIDAEYKQALKPKVLAILTAAAEHIEAAMARAVALEAERAQQAEEDRQRLRAAAIARATGSPE